MEPRAEKKDSLIITASDRILQKVIREIYSVCVFFINLSFQNNNFTYMCSVEKHTIVKGPRVFVAYNIIYYYYFLTRSHFQNLVRKRHKKKNKLR